jgi:hypothetical protein
MAEAVLPHEAEILQDLRQLPTDKIREACDFIGYLKQKYAPSQEAESARPRRGSAEALLQHVGVWRFEPGEREQIMRDIDYLRHLEDD